MHLMNKSALTFQVVLTKADKIKDHERDQILDQVRSKLAKHPAAFPELILTSSEKGEGLATLRAVISGLE
jgi:GTP-binding protein